MSDSQSQNPRREARAQLRAVQATERQQSALNALIAQTEQATGKTVARIVVHYADKTQDTVRSETPAKRRERRESARSEVREAARGTHPKKIRSA